MLGAVLIEILGVKAPPSQSRFPLAEIVTQDRKQNEIDFNYIDFVSFFNFRSVRP